MNAPSHVLHKIWLAGFLVVSELAASASFADAPIRIDDDLRYPFEELYSEPLHAFRPFPIELFAVDFRKGSQATISGEVFLEAIQKSSILRSKLIEAGIDPASATWEQVDQVLKEVGLSAAFDLSDDPVYVSQSPEEYLTRLHRDEYTLLQPYRYDASFLISVLRTEAVDAVSFGGGGAATPVRQTQEVKLDDEFAFDVFEAYGSLRTLSQLQPQLVSAQFESIDTVLSRYPRFANLAKYALGFISIGRPIVLTSAESDLKVPEGLKDIYDFFVVLFAITVKDDLDFVESITFSVGLPQNCSVFDLFPLRYGIEVEVTEEYSAPSVSVEGGGVTVAFSSIFKQTLEYGRLKPTVVGYGLQEAEFGWAFRDEAAGLGSHRVAAIIGVPRKSGNVPYTTSIFVKGKGSFLAEGEIASSKPRTFTLLSN